MASMPGLNAFERFTRKSVWPAYTGFLWALLYAVFVRFYEAATGTVIGGYGKFSDPDAFSVASYAAGVLILLCGFILLGLGGPRGSVVPDWVPVFRGKKLPRLLVLGPTLAGAAFLVAHGITGIITKLLYLAGAIPLRLQGWAEVDMNHLALWDLCFYEPWFLIMGILAGLTAAHYAQASGMALSVFRRGTVLYLIFLLLLSALLICAIIFDFSWIVEF
ncbi:DUF3995 domain-containing protein [Paenibacillus sp. 79R4]|uniref:DUF3995 domain-containing protein n=1 Tax=Paenibacillus sp. 79R4 TaxID=2212847 RepID=UPI0015BD6A18|nr:DUF3995 domain-containing protein [Paenibacillus sp. 79R4]NWL89760.1 DUF3995 domain-containing protein [Paenibacillus sp. 79R4]